MRQDKMISSCLNCCILLISDHHFEIENRKLLNLIFQRSLIGLLSSGAHHWRCSWLLQHNAAAWTPPCSAPGAFFRLPTYGWKTRTDGQTDRRQTLPPWDGRHTDHCEHELMFTWWSGGGCPARLPISPGKWGHRFRRVSDTLRSANSSSSDWLEGK